MSVPVILAALLAALIAALLAGSPPPPPSLPLATVRLDVGEQRLVIELPPVDLPAATPGHDTMVGLPLCHVLVPVSASLHSARVEVVDETGRVLPPDVLHHFNLSDPEHRELFLPIGLHLLAASKETPQIEVPRSEEHTSELQSPCNLVCRLLLEKKKDNTMCNHVIP